jgi:hypothetical protein
MRDEWLREVGITVGLKTSKAAGSGNVALRKAGKEAAAEASDDSETDDNE